MCLVLLIFSLIQKTTTNLGHLGHQHALRGRTLTSSIYENTISKNIIGKESTFHYNKKEGKYLLG